MLKKTFKYLGFGLIGIVLLLLIVIGFFFVKWKLASSSNMKLLGKSVSVIQENGYSFRDLNKNEKLDIYEDKRLPVELRVEDLLQQMTIEEKAGTMFITMIGMGDDGSLNELPSLTEPLTFFLESNSAMVVKKKMSHFNIIQSPSPQSMAVWNNNIQSLAERTRLGIPVTIATDPRHGSSKNVGASIPTSFFSKWCSPLGFAAMRDTTMMRTFGEIAQQEYRALGIRLALSPMADLATEPRWGRIAGTFGEDAELSARLTKAYILGFQGNELNEQSVACMSKHFSGGGPQKNGEDAHFPYGADQIYPGKNFDYHLIPFEKGAFLANTAQIMPYYGVPVGQTSEDVGFGYNKDIITGLLREKYAFEGVICTDWGLISDHSVKPAAAYGVEHLSTIERVAKIIDAGCDMFGGEALPNLLIELVKSNQIQEERINQSVRRILKDKFRLGLFDNPYVDIENLSVIGRRDFVEKGKESQRNSMVLLKNKDKTLPILRSKKIYIKGIDKNIAEKFATVVSNPKDADYIILRLRTPFEKRSQYFLERFFHQGRLYFTEKEKSTFIKFMSIKPVITVINLERPAVIPEINEKTHALIADFDSNDEIIMELIFGKIKPKGKLPFELPSSAEAVENQKEDLPYDSKNPLYPFGFGLSYGDIE